MTPPVIPTASIQQAQESQAATTQQPTQLGQPAGKRSFESVLHQPDSSNAAHAGSLATQPSGPAPTSGQRLERLRLELTERTKGLGHHGGIDTLLPDLTDGKTRRTLLQEAMRGMTNEAFTNGDFKALLGQVEDRWQNVERIMGSTQPLSTGDMLALQARLYQVTQHVEVMSKVVDQVTSGIKTILNTNV